MNITSDDNIIEQCEMPTKLNNWNNTWEQILTNTVGEREKSILFCIVKILGVEDSSLRYIDELRDFKDEHFTIMKLDIINNLRNNMNKIFDADFHFKSKN